jgi:hypothetical protein
MNMSTRRIVHSAKNLAAQHLSPKAYATLARAARRLRPVTKRISAADNPYLAEHPTTYNADGFATVHNTDFLREPKFADAYAKALEGIPPDIAARTDIRWRAHVCCWAATRALRLTGDFVECGVWYGVLSRTMIEYTDFARHADRHFYLVDTFGSLNTRGLEHYDRDIYDTVQRRFAAYPNVHLVRGKVPEMLSRVPSRRIAYLSLDMNGIEPERAALHNFYEKIVPGGIIYLDDYGWGGFEGLKAMVDQFFRDKPETVLQLPSGQGVIIKV